MLLSILGVIASAAAWFAVRIGPRNVWGMLLYDQRREGSLRVGDAAPDVALTTLEGGATTLMSRCRDGKPLVIVFGSFT